MKIILLILSLSWGYHLFAICDKEKDDCDVIVFKKINTILPYDIFKNDSNLTIIFSLNIDSIGIIRGVKIRKIETLLQDTSLLTNILINAFMNENIPCILKRYYLSKEFLNNKNITYIYNFKNIKKYMKIK